MNIEDIIQKTNLIRGYFDDKQMRTLYPFVKLLKENSLLVEIGTFFGKSVRFFSLTNPKIKIITIDKGGFEGCQGVDERVLESKNIEVIKLTSKEAASSFKQIIDFLFIDGFHEEKDVKEDLELWTPFLRKEGLLVCHDSNFQGVETAFRNWQNKSGWQFAEIEDLYITQKGGEVL